jgi:hypothetical protein
MCVVPSTATRGLFCKIFLTPHRRNTALIPNGNTANTNTTSVNAFRKHQRRRRGRFEAWRTKQTHKRCNQHSRIQLLVPVRHAPQEKIIRASEKRRTKKTCLWQNSRPARARQRQWYLSTWELVNFKIYDQPSAENPFLGAGTFGSTSRRVLP